MDIYWVPICNILPYEHLAKIFCCIICMCYRMRCEEEIKLRNLLFHSIQCSPQSSVLMISRMWPKSLVEGEDRNNTQERDISRNVKKKKKWGRRRHSLYTFYHLFSSHKDPHSSLSILYLFGVTSGLEHVTRQRLIGDPNIVGHRNGFSDWYTHNPQKQRVKLMAFRGPKRKEISFRRGNSTWIWR